MDDLFNRKLYEFVDDLVAIYPALNDLRVFKASLYAVNMMDPGYSRRYFRENFGIPFEKQIMARDEKFFLQKDEYKDGDVDIVSRIKTLWVDMLPYNKDTVWKYMQVLVYLGR